MKTSRLICIIILGISFLSACNLPSQSGGGNGPTAWIDSPLNQSSLPLAPVQIVAHGYDAAGISNFELSVNGSVANTLPPSDANGKLFLAQVKWNPPGNGNYTLSMRAQNVSGTWGAPVSVVITIGNSTATPIPSATIPTITPSITPTPAVSSTASPTGSATAKATGTLLPLFTKTPVPSNTPIPTSNALIFVPSLSTHNFQFGTCNTQNSLTISVKVTGPQQVASVQLYTEFHPSGNGNTVELGNSTMDPQSNGDFSRSILMTEFRRIPVYNSGEVHYWFVAYDSAQNQTGKSKTYKDLKFSVCP